MGYETISIKQAEAFYAKHGRPIIPDADEGWVCVGDKE